MPLVFHAASQRAVIADQRDHGDRASHRVDRPSGWEPFAFNPTQPATNYVEFRTGNSRKLGRPINMPLMMVRPGKRGSQLQFGEV